MVVCPMCKRDDVGLSDAGTLKVHFALILDMHPCSASFRCASCGGTGWHAAGMPCLCATGLGPMRRWHGLTWVGWLNLVVLRWVTVRITYQALGDEIIRWGVVLGARPWRWSKPCGGKVIWLIKERVPNSVREWARLTALTQGSTLTEAELIAVWQQHKDENS